MERKEQLEEMLLMLEQAADQLGRTQRVSCSAEHGIAGFDARLDAAFSDVIELRNQTRDALMRHLAQLPRGPKKLPVV